MVNQQKQEDWHIHSSYSRDSRTLPANIVDRAVKRGLKKICVLDHNTIQGGLKAREYAKGKDIEVVVGAEIETDKGEIAGVGLTDEIKSRKLLDVIAEIKNQGAKVLIPHPYGSIRRTKRCYMLEEVAPFSDYIELYNGRSFFNFSTKKTRRLIKEFGLIPVSGSDAHFAFEIGNVRPKFLYRGIAGFFLTGILNLILLRFKKR
ncbi:MAG TPA: PHP domain-containing protein [Candidatus Omnitrophica bacterium]|nr:PHP domain-containing protein [Candidatus Omnitrophota bacterium]